jgi:hypothetical protein
MTTHRPLPFVLLIVVVGPQGLLAQYGQRPQQPRNVNLRDLRDVTVDGTIEGVQGNMLQVKATAGHPYWVALQPGFSKVGVTGTAKPDYLKPGMFVSFTADLPKEKKGEVDEPLTDLAIITESETNQAGMFNEDRDNKESTKYFIRAKVKSYKDGKLTVMAGGKPVVAPVPADLEIKLESTDLAIVRQGDGIKVTGKQVQAYRSEGNNIQVGQVVGQTVDIKLQETLNASTFKKKPAGK